MTIEEVLYSLLRSDAGIRAQIPDEHVKGEIRLYPEQAPASTLFPCAIYHTADNVPALTHEGAVGSDQYVWDLEVWGEDARSAKTLARMIRTKLHGYSGTTHGLKIQGMFLRSESTDHDLPQHAEERGLFAVMMGWELWFRPEQVPASSA